MQTLGTLASYHSLAVQCHGVVQSVNIALSASTRHLSCTNLALLALALDITDV